MLIELKPPISLEKDIYISSCQIHQGHDQDTDTVDSVHDPELAKEGITEENSEWTSLMQTRQAKKGFKET